MSAPNPRFKPTIPNNILPKHLWILLKFSLVDEVFILKFNNDRVASKFLEQRIIELHEYRYLSEICGDWGNAFIGLISTKNRHLDILWLLCDPATSGVESYSSNIREIIVRKIPGASFPQEEVVTQSSSRTSTEASIPEHSKKSLFRAKGNEIVKKKAKQKLPFFFSIMGLFVGLVLFVLWAIFCTGSGTVTPSNNTLLNETTASVAALPDVGSVPQVIRPINTENDTTKNEPSAGVPLSPPPSVSTVNSLFQSPNKSAVAVTTTKQIVKPTSKKNLPIRHMDIFLDNASNFPYYMYHICNESIWKRLIFFQIHSHEFNRFDFSCEKRIDGISFRDSQVYIEDSAALLNDTARLSHLQFDGYSFCSRNEGFRSRSIGPISLKYLTHLEFKNLIDPKNKTDCTELYSWLASDRVRLRALTNLSYAGVKFTSKNRADNHELIRKFFLTGRLKVLNISDAVANVRMFNVTMPPSHLHAVRFYLLNFRSGAAKASLYNLLNTFLAYSTTIIFETNVALSYKEFRHSIPALNKTGIERLKLSVYVSSCEPFSFEFLHYLPKVKSLELTLIFSKKCQMRSKTVPILFHKFDHLASSFNYLQFKVISNANFKAFGAYDLHCREYRISNGELSLNRTPNC